MDKRFLIVIFLLCWSCSSSRPGERASDYFFSPKIGATYVYDLRIGSAVAKKTLEIVNIIESKKRMIFRIAETITFTPSVNKGFRESEKWNIPDKIVNNVEFVVSNNLILIMREQFLSLNGPEIYLKSPIRVGTSWKIRGVSPPLSGIRTWDEQTGKLIGTLPNIKSKKYIIRATISGYKKIKVLGILRECVLVTFEDIDPLEPKAKHIIDILAFCRGIGYVGDEFDESEMLTDIK